MLLRGLAFIVGLRRLLAQLLWRGFHAIQSGPSHRQTVREQSPEPYHPRIKEGASWFIYTEMADEVWWFDGDRHFYLFEEGNGRPGYKRGGVYELDRKSWHIAPKPVVDRLPRAVEGK